MPFSMQLTQCKHFPETTAMHSRTPSIASVSSDSSDAESEIQTPPTEIKKQRTRKEHKKQKVYRPLSELGVYTTATRYNHKHGFDAPLSRLYNHIHSFSESLFRKTLESNARRLKDHCARYLMRVYPSALRVTSSNHEPALCWRHGAQFVALNWQKFDVGMMQNEALFFGTGGYALKPMYVHDANVKKKCYMLSVQVGSVRWG